MELLTKEIQKLLPALYSNDNNSNPTILVKFFCPWNQWTWYVTEGSLVCPNHSNFDCTDSGCGLKENWKDYLFFGLVHGDEKEWGYFALSELEGVSGPSGLKIQRDLYYKPVLFSRLNGG